MAIRSRNKVSVSFSMSSMTDIVFLLLIFFIIVSTMVSPNALKVLLPKSKAKTSSPQTVSVTISIGVANARSQGSFRARAASVHDGDWFFQERRDEDIKPGRVGPPGVFK